MVIIDILSQAGTLRYGELKKNLSGITHKMLSQQLKDLKKKGLILRRSYHQIPPESGIFSHQEGGHAGTHY